MADLKEIRKSEAASLGRKRGGGEWGGLNPKDGWSNSGAPAIRALPFAALESPKEIHSAENRRKKRRRRIRRAARLRQVKAYLQQPFPRRLLLQARPVPHCVGD